MERSGSKHPSLLRLRRLLCSGIFQGVVPHAGSVASAQVQTSAVLHASALDNIVGVSLHVSCQQPSNQHVRVIAFKRSNQIHLVHHLGGIAECFKCIQNYGTVEIDMFRYVRLSDAFEC
jgi:hypothetical protein